MLGNRTTLNNDKSAPIGRRHRIVIQARIVSISTELRRQSVTRFILLLGIYFVAIAPGQIIAQRNAGDPHMPGAVGCADSATPGRLPPNTDCAILVHKNLAVLPPGPLVWRFENFSTIEAAQSAATPTSAVVEAGGRV